MNHALANGSPVGIGITNFQADDPLLNIQQLNNPQCVNDPFIRFIFPDGPGYNANIGLLTNINLDKYTLLQTRSIGDFVIQAPYTKGRDIILKSMN